MNTTKGAIYNSTTPCRDCGSWFSRTGTSAPMATGVLCITIFLFLLVMVSLFHCLISHVLSSTHSYDEGEDDGERINGETFDESSLLGLSNIISSDPTMSIPKLRTPPSFTPSPTYPLHHANKDHDISQNREQSSVERSPQLVHVHPRSPTGRHRGRMAVALGPCPDLDDKECGVDTASGVGGGGDNCRDICRRLQSILVQNSGTCHSEANTEVLRDSLENQEGVFSTSRNRISNLQKGVQLKSSSSRSENNQQSVVWQSKIRSVDISPAELTNSTPYRTPNEPSPSPVPFNLTDTEFVIVPRATLETLLGRRIKPCSSLHVRTDNKMETHC